MYDISDTGAWDRNAGYSGDSDCSSGGCDECGRADGEDRNGRYLVDFYADVESASLILCPGCYAEATGSITEDIEKAHALAVICEEAYALFGPLTEKERRYIKDHPEVFGPR